jgi:hypothetical protein
MLPPTPPPPVESLLDEPQAARKAPAPLAATAVPAARSRKVRRW